MVDDDIVAGSEVAGAMLSLFEGFIYVCPSVSIYVCICTCECSANTGQKGESYLLTLKLQIAVGCLT